MTQMEYEDYYGESREDLLRPWEPEIIPELDEWDERDMDELVSRYWELDFELKNPYNTPEETEDFEYEQAGIIESVEDICKGYWDNWQEMAAQYLEERGLSQVW